MNTFSGIDYELREKVYLSKRPAGAMVARLFTMQKAAGSNPAQVMMVLLFSWRGHQLVVALGLVLRFKFFET